MNELVLIGLGGTLSSLFQKLWWEEMTPTLRAYNVGVSLTSLSLILIGSFA